MKKFNLSCKTHLFRIAAILCLLSSYLWIAPSQVHALPAGFQEYSVLGNEEQTYATAAALADNQMVYYGPWKNGYKAGLLNPIQPTTEVYDDSASNEQTQPQTFALSLEDYLWSTEPLQTDKLSLSISKGDVPQTPGESNPSAPALDSSTTLTVSIISSPWATLDSNDPDGSSGPVPQVFVVEAVITNITETITVTDVVVTLDYEDPGNGWVLLDGEDEVRTVGALAPGASYHAYWFASYPITDTLGHEYTVTVEAAGVSPIATSENSYENPNGYTVETRGTNSVGMSRLVNASAEIVVGAAFTVTAVYDLGTDPSAAIFSPVGNVDFYPGAYRLMATEADLYTIDAGGNRISDVLTATDRLYLPLPETGTGVGADVIYTFIALTPSNTRLCPYAVAEPRTGQKAKYDQFYCSSDRGTIVPITGTLTLSQTKQVSSDTIEQGQWLTYTIHYTNTGDEALQFAWIRDDVPTDTVSIVTDSIDPDPDPTFTTDSRIAWNPGTIPPTSTYTLTFAVRVDGNDDDLPDETDVVNTAFFEIVPPGSSLGERIALSSTVSTIVKAPMIALSKTDGQDTAQPGDLLTYTLLITNSGSVATSGLVITDELPAGVTLAGTPTPGFIQNDRTLVWDSLESISPDGGTLDVTIPVMVNLDVPDETILTNTMTVKYENPAGHVFATKTAMDTTTVHASPTVAFTAASQSGAEDVGTMTITAQLDKVSDLDVTIPFTLSGTATQGAGQDYTITPSPVVIPAGDTSVDIIITVNDDSLYEADETVIVTMGTPTNADKGTPAVHTATITDNDEAEKPTVAFTAASQSGAEDVGTMTITAQLDKVSGLDVTIPFTVGGTATQGAGQDYTITPSPVVIPAGDTSVDIIITVNDDSLYEADETVIVTMGTPTNADKGTPAVHTATITDNDGDYNIYLPIILRNH